MKIIDGKDAVLGRLASYVAKEALKGEEIAVLNCEQIIITGSRKNIKENFEAKRGRVGSSQKGPRHSRTNEKIVKRAIRGMVPTHRQGRGREAYKRIKCYSGIPKEFQDKEIIKMPKNLIKKPQNKFIQIKELAKNE